MLLRGWNSLYHKVGRGLIRFLLPTDEDEHVEDGNTNGGLVSKFISVGANSEPSISEEG